MEKDIQAKSSRKRAGVAILVSDIIDFMSKKITKDREGHYVLIKGSIHQKT